MSRSASTERTPDVKTVVEPRESVVDGLVRAAGQAGFDPMSAKWLLQDTVDMEALEELFHHGSEYSITDRPVIELELLGSLFVVSPSEIEIYDAE